MRVMCALPLNLIIRGFYFLRPSSRVLSPGIVPGIMDFFIRAYRGPGIGHSHLVFYVRYRSKNTKCCRPRLGDKSFCCASLKLRISRKLVYRLRRSIPGESTKCNKKSALARFFWHLVLSPGIEPGSQVPQTYILSIKL